VRDRIPKGSEIPAQAARDYVETLVRGADDATRAKYFSKPSMADSLEKWAAFVAKAAAELAR
jgi:hypothetical protein